MTGVRIHATATIRPPGQIAWRAADPRGFGHAFERGARRSACNGVEAFDARFAWPVEVRCEGCLVIVGAEQVRQAPITESELRLLDGNR